MPSATLGPLVHFAGLALGVLVLVLLLGGRRGNRNAGRWLAAYVLNLMLLSAGDLLEDSRWVLVLPHAAHAADWSVFLVGPVLWMYVRRLTMHATPSLRRWLLHTLPAVLCLLVLLPFYALPADRKLALVAAELAQPSDGADPVLLIAAAQMLAYWIAGLVTLHRYRRALRGSFSSLQGRTFGWLGAMLGVNLGMWVLWLAAMLCQWDWAEWLDTLAVPLGMYVLAFLGARQVAAFRGVVSLPDPDSETGSREKAESDANTVAAGSADAGPARYRRSGLDPKGIPELLGRLESLMRSEKPWLENDLTLGELAERAGLSSHHLSQVLNAELNTTFFDYINRQRVAEVQRCLADAAYDEQSILDIALASGFNSKAAFNATFRAQAGLTPSQYRARVRVARSAATP